MKWKIVDRGPYSRARSPEADPHGVKFSFRSWLIAAGKARTRWKLMRVNNRPWRNRRLKFIQSKAQAAARTVCADAGAGDYLQALYSVRSNVPS